MSDSEEDEYDMFERQLKFEKQEKERRGKCSNIEHGATRTDPDGTVYEWDADKMAYFPKIDANFIAQYQMNYGENTEKSSEAPSATDAAVTTPPAMASNSGTDWSEYFTYVQKYISEHGDYPPGITQVHKDYYVYYYNYYYGNKDGQKKEGTADKIEESEGGSKLADQKKSDTQDKEVVGESASGDKENRSKTSEKSDENEKSSETEEETAEEKAYREYYEYYGAYYKEHGSGGPVGNEQSDFDQWAWYNYYYGDSKEGDGVGEEGKEEEEKKEEEEAKQTKKRKANEPQGWFEIDQTRNTNVYVSGLPDDVTDEEYEALMNKCGMISLDPRTRRLKLKLYRNSEGKPKGDGLCCYIKPESVELALQVLDEYDVRGHKISVERAKFQMKGAFDPKKRKKLSNREKKKIRQHQEKLLDWRPDKPKGFRAKHERVLVIKNAFDPVDFEGNPAKIQVLREELRGQCANFGLVKKVIIYDRHTEGVITVGFAEADEADMGKESLHGRYFQRRQIMVETWDGKTKYDVQETEQEREARLKQWANFLETGGETTPGGNQGRKVTKGETAAKGNQGEQGKPCSPGTSAGSGDSKAMVEAIDVTESKETAKTIPDTDEGTAGQKGQSSVEKESPETESATTEAQASPVPMDEQNTANSTAAHS